MRFSALLLSFSVLLVSFGAPAQPAKKAPVKPNVEKVLTQITAKDFRLRTQAALALGVSADLRAVPPLCKALEDKIITVRVAAAAALGRLDLGGGECLDKLLKVEKVASAKKAMQEAIAIMGGVPNFTEQTLYYVAIGKLADKSDRSPGEMDQRVRRGMRAAEPVVKTVAFAPPWETLEEAKAVLAKHPKLKGYFLSPNVSPFQYSGSGLLIKIDAAMFSYPEKSLIGTIRTPVTYPQVDSKDTESENELIAIATGRIIEKFAKLAPTLRD